VRRGNGKSNLLPEDCTSRAENAEHKKSPRTKIASIPNGNDKRERETDKGKKRGGTPPDTHIPEAK
jgi:hypothetical protein